jgi:hypothetical protein
MDSRFSLNLYGPFAFLHFAVATFYTRRNLWSGGLQGIIPGLQKLASERGGGLRYGILIHYYASFSFLL